MTGKIYTVETDFDNDRLFGVGYPGKTKAQCLDLLKAYEKQITGEGTGVFVEGYLEVTLKGTADDLIPVWNIEGCNGECQYYTRGGQTGRAFETYRRTPRSTGIENTTLSGLYGLWFILPDYFDDSSDVWHEFMIDPKDPYGIKNPNKQIVYVTKSKKTEQVIKTEYYGMDQLDVASIMGVSWFPINADYQFIQTSDIASTRLLTYDPTKK